MTDTFTHPNETTITFFDEDGYQYSVVIPNARDEPDARSRAHQVAREKIVDGVWRPHGTLLIGGLNVKATAHRPSASARSGRYAAEAAWRAQAAAHLQGAIAELERAAALMPVSRERALIDRALRATARTFRECTCNLEAVRSRLEIDGPGAQQAIGAQP